jgi:hypothetical protein
MRKQGIIFDELRELLLELGFCEQSEKTRLRFTHPTAGTVLRFRSHAPKEIVSARDMLVVRRQLVDNGLIESSAFDQFLQKAPA